MRTDIYTKAVLTVIAIMLTVIACKALISPGTTASAQSTAFAGVQFTGDVGHISAFDTRTGEFWGYKEQKLGSMDLVTVGRITKLGQPQIVLSVDK